MPIFTDPNDPRSKLPHDAQEELFKRGERPGKPRKPINPNGMINSQNPATGFTPWSGVSPEGAPALDAEAVRAFEKSLKGQ